MAAIDYITIPGEAGGSGLEINLGTTPGDTPDLSGWASLVVGEVVTWLGNIVAWNGRRTLVEGGRAFEEPMPALPVLAALGEGAIVLAGKVNPLIPIAYVAVKTIVPMIAESISRSVIGTDYTALMKIYAEMQQINNHLGELEWLHTCLWQIATRLSSDDEENKPTLNSILQEGRQRTREVWCNGERLYIDQQMSEMEG